MCAGISVHPESHQLMFCQIFFVLCWNRSSGKIYGVFMLKVLEKFLSRSFRDGKQSFLLLLFSEYLLFLKDFSP